jgi:hypothetical protein
VKKVKAEDLDLYHQADVQLEQSITYSYVSVTSTTTVSPYCYLKYIAKNYIKLHATETNLADE